MDPVRNPYVPGAGNPPPELAGRSNILDEASIALKRLQAGRSPQSLILVGLRGVGKTVLLNRISDIAQDLGFFPTMIEANENNSLPQMLIPQLKKALFSIDAVASAKNKAKYAFRVLRSFINTISVRVGEIDYGISVSPEPGVGDSGNFKIDLSDTLIAIGEAASAAGKYVCILIDELQYVKIEEFEALIMSIHKLNQKTLPVIFVGAGLPQILALAGESKSYAERLFRYPTIGALSPDDGRLAITNPARNEGVTYTEEAIEKILATTERYPYFLQQWAHDSWNVAQGPTIQTEDVILATQVALRSLDESFFKVRFDRCTPSERRYMRSLADLGPGSHRSGDIAERQGVKTTSVAPVRSSLIRKGMIYSPAHGDTAFTVPMFDAYMRRAMPTTNENNCRADCFLTRSASRLVSPRLASVSPSVLTRPTTPVITITTWWW
jgi:hypothetical protein